MTTRQISLHVVGADHPNRPGPNRPGGTNRQGGGNRRFEILLCTPGEPVTLAPEPRNPVDPNAVAVMSARGIQIGYLTAERAPWIGSMLRADQDLRAIFQSATPAGAAIRLAFDGEDPILPPPTPPDSARHQPDDGFWPDPIPPDD